MTKRNDKRKRTTKIIDRLTHSPSKHKRREVRKLLQIQQEKHFSGHISGFLILNTQSKRPRIQTWVNQTKILKNAFFFRYWPSQHLLAPAASPLNKAVVLPALYTLLRA
jgi:hypothetical protein